MFLPLLTSSAEYILLLRNAVTLVKDQLHPEYKSLGRLKQHVLRLLIATPRFSWPGEHKVGMTEVQNDFAFRLTSLLYNSESRSFSLKNKPYGEQEVLDAPLVKNQNRDDRRAEYGIAKSITIFKDLGRHSASHPGSTATDVETPLLEGNTRTAAALHHKIIVAMVMTAAHEIGSGLDPHAESSTRTAAELHHSIIVVIAMTAALGVGSGPDPRDESSTRTAAALHREITITTTMTAALMVGSGLDPRDENPHPGDRTETVASLPIEATITTITTAAIHALHPETALEIAAALHALHPETALEIAATLHALHALHPGIAFAMVASHVLHLHPWTVLAMVVAHAPHPRTVLAMVAAVHALHLHPRTVLAMAAALHDVEQAKPPIARPPQRTTQIPLESEITATIRTHCHHRVLDLNLVFAVMREFISPFNFYPQTTSRK